MLKVYTDGASRGNPGLAGAGILITDADGNVLKQSWKFLGKRTNNASEYLALLESLKQIKGFRKKGLDKTKIRFHADSLLMVRQINGDFKVKDEQLIQYKKEFLSTVKKMKIDWKIIHIPRKENSAADKLANRAIDEREVQQKFEFDQSSVPL